MSTYWHKERYLASDRCPDTGGLLPGAMPPGFYCKDHAALVALVKGASDQGTPLGADVTKTGRMAYSVAGTPVYVATPEEAVLLKAITPTKAPDFAPRPKPSRRERRASASMARRS